MRIQRGFTIVELLIVVVVIAILVGISYTAYTGIIDHTYDTRKAADIRNFEIELSQYKEQHGCLPGECTADLRQPSGRLADGLQINLTTKHDTIISSAASGDLITLTPESFRQKYRMHLPEASIYYYADLSRSFHSSYNTRVFGNKLHYVISSFKRSHNIPSKYRLLRRGDTVDARNTQHALSGILRKFIKLGRFSFSEETGVLSCTREKGSVTFPRTFTIPQDAKFVRPSGHDTSVYGHKEHADAITNANNALFYQLKPITPPSQIPGCLREFELSIHYPVATSEQFQAGIFFFDE